MLQTALEIGPQDPQTLLGMGQSLEALDINDPEPKYTLRSLPGTFSGLHLCCLMYAAFK
ncbi:MAG: hypothetical protein ACKOEO_25285 [Planctomycetaceae bacterium]